MNRAILLPLVLVIATVAWLTGCETMKVAGELGGLVGVATGTMTTNEAASLVRTTTAVAKTFEDITPEQEYFIGRAVSATILNKYKPYSNDAAHRYLNLLGQSLALASTKPETFGGYHFLILDSDEINAFAAPGGFILVTRGMLRCCRSEDALAAVLAHEIGHVQNQHGLKAIKQGRLTSALTILAVESAKTFGGEDLAELTTAFEGSITDITGTLMNSGYARGQERDADKGAVQILKQVGYDPQALVDMLEQMKKNLKPGGLDFAKTHPDPEDRIQDIRGWIRSALGEPPPAARQRRFEQAIKGI
jgi:predicted Zn-dependent protease